MKMTNIEAENNRFKKELLALKKQNKKLSQKLEKTKNKTEGLKKELKKNDVQTIKLSEEQEHSLSNLLKDTNILNLLLD